VAGGREVLMVDTHAHLSVCEPADADLVATAREAGVRRILTVGLEEESNREAISAAERHEEVLASVGRHPNSASGFDAAAVTDLAALAAHPRVRAIGETGLDFYRDGAPLREQRRAFAAQIEVARDCDLPLVIHVRDRDGSGEAVDEVFETLEARAAGVAVILHCFSAPDRVNDAAERGWYCSFAGNLTYPKAEALRAAAAEVPDQLLLVETDSPFLAPQPVRGRPNQPSNVVATAAAMADVRGVPLDALERTIEENAKRVLKW
jgi:TatD DNase family protein